MIEGADGSLKLSGKTHNHGRVHGKAEVQTWKSRVKEMAKNKVPTRKIVSTMGELSQVFIFPLFIQNCNRRNFYTLHTPLKFVPKMSKNS